MPSLSFVLPHWLYWATLLIFPLIAMYLLSRQRVRPPDQRPSLFIAYLFWFLAGYLGIHRFYLRSSWGVVFIPVFLAIIYCNGQVREVCADESRTFAAMEQAQAAVERARPREGVEPTAESRAELDRAHAELNKNDAEYRAAKSIGDEWKAESRISAGVRAVG